MYIVVSVFWDTAQLFRYFSALRRWIIILFRHTENPYDDDDDDDVAAENQHDVFSVEKMRWALSTQLLKGWDAGVKVHCRETVELWEWTNKQHYVQLRKHNKWLCRGNY